MHAPIIENHYHYRRRCFCAAHIVALSLYLLNAAEHKFSLCFSFVASFGCNRRLSNPKITRPFSTYIIIYVFIVMSTDFVYADPLGCNWMMAGTFVDALIAMRTEIVTCKLIFLVGWISKCGTAYGRCKNDELKRPKNVYQTKMRGKIFIKKKMP